jgi:hypothetical protein
VPPPINNTDGGKNRQRPRGKPNRSGETGEAEAQDVNEQAPQTIKKKKRRPRNRRPKSTKPWLSSIPAGTVDPISLDPLEELDYPPFALVMEPPYIGIFPGMWPPPDVSNDEDKKVGGIKEEKKEERGREEEILKEQWGEGVVPQTSSTSNGKMTSGSADSQSMQGRQFYLFDGYVLAGYLTRTLQFINPYNRRDLTREELAALDAYMVVHKLGNAGVVQAYGELFFTLHDLLVQYVFV